MTDDLIRKVFIEFLTQTQKYKLGTASFQTFINYLCKYINNMESYACSYDLMQGLTIYHHDDPTQIVLSVDFDTVTQTFNVLAMDIEYDSDNEEEQQAKRTVGFAALFFMNAITSWETEELVKYIESQRGIKVNLFLSKLDVEVTKEEKDVIEGLLKKMAEKQNFYYKYLEKVAFEVELRAIYPETAPKIPDIDIKETGDDDDDFDWI